MSRVEGGAIRVTTEIRENPVHDRRVSYLNTLSGALWRGRR